MTIIRANQKLGYLLFTIALAILLLLGGWQFLRGREKANIDALSADGLTSNPIVDEAPVNWEKLAYQSVQLRGNWQSQRYFLMDNRLNNGQPGYETLVPFTLLKDGSTLLVNRGWSPQHEAADLAQPSDSGSEQLVKGQLYIPQKGFTLGPTYIGDIQWPLTVLYYDMNALSEALGRELAVAVLVIDPGEAHSLARIWQPRNITPARHYAYATQWWGLALTLIIFGFIWRRSVNAK